MSDTHDTVIRFKDVNKEYKLYKDDKHRLLGIFFSRVPHRVKKAGNGLNFSIRKGESVALLGKNGAGKSTVLKMITGVCFPTSGEVIVEGRVSALLELTAGFDGEFSGIENIYLRGRVLGIPDSEIKELLPDILEFADIGEYIDQPTRTYSSGMKARLGFAINVSTSPDILIVDEVLSVGDESFKKKCRKKIRELIEDQGVTLLFVTHSDTMAREFCTRGLLLSSGEIVFDGDIDEAISKYGDMA